MNRTDPSTTHEEIVGFVVDAFPLTVHGRPTVALVGRGSCGRTFAVMDDRVPPRLYVREGDHSAARRLLQSDLTATDRRTMDGESVAMWTAPSVSRLRTADTTLRGAGVRTYEADFSAVDVLRLETGVIGSFHIHGAARRGSHVDVVFHNPVLAAAEWDPELSVLSIDIETNAATEEIIAVSLVRGGSAQRSDAGESEVIIVGDVPPRRWITPVADEEALLRRLVERVSAADPDIITGWNVIDFDMAVISRRLERYGIPFAVARTDEPARFLPADRDGALGRRNAGVACRGRQVIDGLRLLRYGPQHFPDRTLEGVAQAVLGEGKSIQVENSRRKVESIMHLYREDPVELCSYCRRDAELVLRILDRTGLMHLTVARSRFTGVGLNRAWTSIPAFELLYTEAMHRRGLVAPTAGVDRLAPGEAPGGAILPPQPGLHDDVLVFDFKSLYPSIMRTFNIDPVAYRGRTEALDAAPPDAAPPDADPPGQTIDAPNGARFSRDVGILPLLLDRFWSNRDHAKASGDVVGTYVYKIVMNSFYGVLGSPQCRFSGAALAGAITSFGQHLLHWTQEAFERRGFAVLYGDTDSLFVPAHRSVGTGGPVEGRAGDDGTTHDHGTAEGEGEPRSAGELHRAGRALASELNAALSEYIRSTWGVESRLELEFEKAYRRLLLPRMRGVAGGDHERGRAKSYAGLVVAGDGDARPDGAALTDADGAGAEADRLEIKGMEAVRSDWTRAAATFQTQLLEVILRGGTTGAVETLIRDSLAVLRSGDNEEELVYARRLRKPVSAYTKSRPPHVQAALLLPAEEREGTIRFLMTTAGPQPPSVRTAPLDLEHYAQKQLRPIAETLCAPLGIDVGPLFDASQQLSLF